MLRYSSGGLEVSSTMKTALTESTTRLSPPPILSWVRAVSTRLSTRDGAPSIDGLDAAIRGFAVGTVALLSLLGYGRPDQPIFPTLANPLVVAAALIAYNFIVISAFGVPWRHAPGFGLFVLDWLVASTAILLTGGFFSPFNILYYALVIGAALRIGLPRSVMLVTCCALMYLILSLLRPDPEPAVRLPILVVEIASLAMVMFMSVGMKRAVEVEVRKVELEEQAAGRFRLLNSLTNTVLSGSPDLEHVTRMIISVSSEAMRADSGLAVLFDSSYTDDHRAAILPSEDELVIVADNDPNPATLSVRERQVLKRARDTRRPVMIQDVRAEEYFAPSPPYPGLERGSEQICAIACVPFLLDDRVIGAMFVGRYTPSPFTIADVSLLTAISQQMAVAVRLARLYDLEREKAVRSEERERLGRDLLSTVSHELRTPLTSIKTSVGALAASGQQEASRSPLESRLLSNVERSTDKLINMVNELLDMSRLRAGRVTLNPQVLNMGELLLDAASQVLPLLDARRQTLIFDLPAPGSPRWHKLNALADRRRIEQVILNLLSNANKYGPTGSKIVLGATPRDGAVRIFVRDEGPGIARYEQRLVFDKFYQGSTATEGGGRPDSTGLGLAIARSIVELHGGQIGVSSKLGLGSTFYFTLPYDG